MITTTTDVIEGKKIIRYLGIVTGEAVLGSNIYEDLFHGLKGIVSGSSNKIEQKLSRARALALKVLRENAAALGANAVVGIDLDYAAMNAGQMMLMVIASGTAVITEEGERKS